MGGIFTDKKRYNHLKDTFRIYRNSTGEALVDVPIELYSDQATTSYRTGRREDKELELSNAEILRNAQEDARKINQPWDTGHEFNTEKREWKTTDKKPVSIPNPLLFGGSRFVGPLIPYSDPSLVDYIAIPNADPSIGAKLINMAIPDKPSAKISQAFFENALAFPELPGKALTLLERADTARRSAIKTGKVIGDEGLNLAFGFEPLIQDVAKIAAAVIDSTSLIKQYLRDSGLENQVRRNRGLNPINTGSITVDKIVGGNGRGGGMPFHGWYAVNFNNNDYDCAIFRDGLDWQAQYTVTERISTRYWFSGAFSYYVHSGKSWFDQFLRYEQLANKLIGTRLTPDSLWALAPWTWLSDWWLDFGTIISNATLLGQDGQVIRYGYLMCDTIAQKTVTVSSIPFSNGTHSGIRQSTFTSRRKQRVRATPYGFGVDLNTLSDQQWAILAFLGLTKGSSRQLRS